MKKAIINFACSFNDWMWKKHGVLSASVSMGKKEVHLKADAFFEMFDEYGCQKRYLPEYDKVYVREGDTLFFALVEREETKWH